MTSASYIFCLGTLNNVVLSRFVFGLTFLFLPVIFTHISFSQCLNSAADYIALMFLNAQTTHRRSAVMVPPSGITLDTRGTSDICNSYIQNALKQVLNFPHIETKF